MNADRMFAEPPNVPAAELFAKLCAQNRPGETVPFPRYDHTACPLHAKRYPTAEERDEPGCKCTIIGSLFLRVLTQDELEDAKASALVEAKTRLAKQMPTKDDATESLDDLVSMYTNVEVLFRACRKDATGREPFFRTPLDVRSLLFVDEVGVLVNAYLRVQNTLGPFITGMDEHELDAILDKLEAGGISRSPLDWASLGLLKALLMRSVSRCASSRTASSSSGTPPVEPTPETSPATPSP